MTTLAQLSLLDLRARLPRAAWSIGTRVGPPTSVTCHYNGPPVGNRTHDGEIAQIVYDARFQMRPGALGARNGGDGLQYHFVVLSDGTLCQTRDTSAILWHCANVTGNTTSLAVHMPLGGDQDTTTAQWNAATRLCDVLLDQYKMGGRQLVRGHQEWSENQCPGPNIMRRLRAWRETLPSHQRFAVAYDVANVRRAPSVEASVALTMQAGEVLDADAIVTGQSIAGEARWAHRADGLGFVHLSLLRRIPDGTTVPQDDSTASNRYRIRFDGTRVYALPNVGMPNIAVLNAGDLVEARSVVVGQSLGNEARWVQISVPFGGYIHVSMVVPLTT